MADDWKWTHSLTLELPNGYKLTSHVDGSHDSPLVPLAEYWASEILDQIDRGELPKEYDANR